MGSNSSSNSGNSGSDAFVNKKSKVKPVKRDKFGYTVKENPVKKFISGGGVIGAVTKPFRDSTEKVNRKFFEEKVKPAGKSKYDTYEDYIRARGRGEVDAYGREIKSTGNDNQVVQAPLEATTMPVEAPKSIEVAEPVMTAEEARAKASDLIRKKRKGVGRGTLIATSPQGVTNEGLTLSNKSLLG